MKIRRTDDHFHIDLSPAEARVLFEELSSVRGGARMPKLRQVCEGLDAVFSLPTPPKLGRPPSKKLENDAV